MKSREKHIKELSDGLETAFINHTYNSNLAYRPEFISNNYKQGKKVVVSIEQELTDCEEFQISVAFITKSGITPLLQTLKELEEKKIPGRILTTDYLMFSEPEALKKLQELKNIELKMFCTDKETGGFHTKGYIFKREEIYRIIIGSSNMTMNAITKNREWNMKIVSTENGELAREVLEEFEEFWNDSHTFAYEDFIGNYRQKYLENQIIKKQKQQTVQEEVVELERYILKPNKMQAEFVNNVMQMQSQNIEKALLLSSTGTGKTYAAAFAMRELGFEKVLFLVHRNQIAKQALKSFQKVLSKKVSVGMVSGSLGRQEFDKDYIFATVQTFSKTEILNHFKPEHFDAIIYDEAHHTSAGSYKKIMEYFHPRLSLGMTATPDKRDDNIEGRNIYEIFDHNIAYEIRLQQAMEEDFLCPFHYFGITDLKVIGDENGSREEQLENFRYLVSDDRVDYVMEQANYYGFSGERVKGLIFCSRVEEARELSEKFNQKGWRTVCLTGADSEGARSEAVERLVSDNIAEVKEEDRLDYILSVDIFSEGVDVPEINQVIMLRPTQSPIVFIQQLGRGLRKNWNKEYVVVLDFIGNYKNNFMIPIALSGDRTYNKDNIRKYVVEGSRIIPGASTLHFDEISRKRIFQAIDNANFSDIKLIKENYQNLKNKLGHIPALMDFDKYGEMDVLRIFDNNNLGSYYKFLQKYEKEYKVRLSSDEEKVVEFISKKLANGKRIHELELLNRMLNYQHGIIGIWADDLREKYGITLDRNKVENVINIMTNEFPAGTGKRTYEKCVFLEKEQNELSRERRIRIRTYAEQFLGKDVEYHVSKNFSKMLANPEFYQILKELVEFGISRYQTNYSVRYGNTDFVLYQKYTYEDACRLLGWEHNEVPLNIGGYKFDKKTKTFPVFINYDKSEDISDTTKYEDHFTSNHRLIAISKSGRSIQSEDVQNFLYAKERGIDVQLFVRKNKDDRISKEFYYLGSMEATGVAKEFTMPNTEKTAVEIEWSLDTPVRSDIYDYITMD
ncbi:MAG: DEAD/DEAH box helicase [Lachnospiraceae bacterium]|nr:DEAD/DEAH box helicase [Lachnospiraceae bacterium]